MLEDLSPVIEGWNRLRLPRLGTIALGVKDDRGIPHAVDYFVCPPEVQAVYGPEPRALDVMFPSEDLSIVFPCSYQRWTDQFGLVCRGDGRVANLSALYATRFGEDYGVAYDAEQDRFLDPRTGEGLPVGMGAGGKSFIRISCAGKQCPFVEKGKCRPVGRLSFLLPKVPGVLGVYQIATGSVNSYLNIVGGLATLRNLLGRISFVPVKLRVRVEEAHPVVGSGQEKRQVKSTISVLYLDMGEWTLERVIEMARERQLIRAVALPPGPAVVELEPVDEEEKPELLFPPEQPEPEPEKQVPEAPEASPDVPARPAVQAAPPPATTPAAGRAAPAASKPAPAEPAPPAPGGKTATPEAKPAATARRGSAEGQGGGNAPTQAAQPSAESPEGSVCGEFEVLSAPVARKDREGRDVLVFRVRALETEGVDAGVVLNAFSAPGIHPYARQTIAGSKLGTRLLLQGRRVRSDALVVEQALVATDS